jgi:hypothetical protein
MSVFRLIRIVIATKFDFDQLECEENAAADSCSLKPINKSFFVKEHKVNRFIFSPL